MPLIILKVLLIGYTMFCINNFTKNTIVKEKKSLALQNKNIVIIRAV